MKGYRWYDVVVAFFVASLIVSNIIAAKLVNLFGLVLPAAVILFPVTYILGDVLTEVYGYARARRAIWVGFAANALAVAAIAIGGWLPPASFWTLGVYDSPAQAQQAYQALLGFTPRLLVASFSAYLVGEFLNAWVLAKLKVRTQGRYLWMRTIGSTIVGQGADAAVFITLAFWGVLPPGALGQAILSQWGFKVAYESLATPLTYWVVNRLKRAEGVDVYDVHTDFRPWALT
ncbi:MAG: queuosine precursor transporter [Chloroflexi bacterium]|nr:queuosine precursor transporter [Chloroflexota bacterium]